jgi:alkanesulfonate monooxygenase SsuD/methylene tetrahydromethanopterin reductase-like flavin-dependent oxidoreductase (luciferase family)
MRAGVWMPNAMPFGLERGFFLDWVRLADQAGFDTLSTLDRPNYDMWDPLASLAAAAAATDRIRLATTTLPLPNRNEVLVAKQAAVIDRLSGGRLTLGVSLGSRPDDYEVLAATLEHRVTRFRRQVTRIRQVWAEARQSDREHGVLGPPPVQDPGPPIWRGERDAGRAVSDLGDVDAPPPLWPASTMRPSWTSIQAASRLANRNRSPAASSSRSPSTSGGGGSKWATRSPNERRLKPSTAPSGIHDSEVTEDTMRTSGLPGVGLGAIQPSADVTRC